jgi:Tol biopolymer transport system component
VSYQRVSPSLFPGKSQYFLSPNGQFGVEFLRTDLPASQSFYWYMGGYSRVDSLLRFDFDSSSSAGPWTATAVLHGDSLRVRYSSSMALAHFDDGIYVLSPTPEDIYLGSADGSGAPARLTRGGWPAWSPDARRIAFQRDGHVCVIDANGSNEACPALGVWPTWSPDGKRIAFTSTEGIAVMNADGSGIKLLIRHRFRTDTYAPWDMGVGKPAWSPDGQHIAFEHLGDGDLQGATIFVMKADGSDVRPLTTPDAGAESDPAWSADGATIYLWCYKYGLASVAATGGVPTAIHIDFPTIAYGARPTPSPDGRAVAFTAHDVTTGAAGEFTFGGNSIRIISPSGQGGSVLFPNGYEPTWSPDGKQIAFVRSSK